MAKDKTEPTESTVTPEQMEALMLAREKSLKSQIGFLKVELEFNQLQADIADAQARYLKAHVIMAQIKAGPPEEKVPSKREDPNKTQVEVKEPIFRTLKKDE